MDDSGKVFYGNMCFVCHKTIKEKELKKCSSCKLVFYCSEAHQKIHWKHHSHLCKVFHKIDLVLKPDNFEDDSSWYKYRTELLMLCELKLGRKLQPCETNMILFPNNCQICHKKYDLEPCLNCLCVNYCSEDHKQADFASHKKICQSFALCVELDLLLERRHFYPSYYLWDGNFSLLDSIDSFIENNVKIEKHISCSPTQEKALVSELLTCPLSLLFALMLVKFNFKENFTVHIVGCSFLETASPRSWETILHIKPIIKNLVLHLIGPEVKEIGDGQFCPSCRDKLTFKCSTEFYHDYLKGSPLDDPDVICSFNSGFHEFEDSDMDTWNKTLPLLVRHREVPFIFTSFTESEAERDSKLLFQINEKLNVKIMKNKFSSMRPYRDLENLGVYYNNEYITLVSNES